MRGVIKEEKDLGLAGTIEFWLEEVEGGEIKLLANDCGGDEFSILKINNEGRIQLYPECVANGLKPDEFNKNTIVISKFPAEEEC